MKFKVLTLFPEMILSGLHTSIIGRAMENNLIELEAINIRDYTQDRHGKVDDYTYGGGAGMLMQAQPVYDAWRAAAGRDPRAEEDGGKPPRTVYVTPRGIPFTQSYAADLAKEEQVIFLCGHYEGIDERVLEEIVTDNISIGDYVLTGGELPAMVMIDAISRLVPGVLHNEESTETESFHRNLLEYPQYSRPEVWMGKKVPEVLLSGDHRKIAAWRLEKSLELTRRIRPDLFARYTEQEELIDRLAKRKRLCIHMMESLRRGRGEILFWNEDLVFLYDGSCRMGMFHAFSDIDPADNPEFLAVLPEDMTLAVTTGERWNSMLRDRMSFEVTAECVQACWTQKNPMPVRYKDIRILQEEHLPYLVDHYRQENAGYLEELLRKRMLYGAFVDDRLVGFAGWHSDGSLGLLYVEDAYRKLGIGASLEAYTVNRCLEMGYVPYGHIRSDNEVSKGMQEKLGLYVSKEKIWWLERPVP